MDDIYGGLDRGTYVLKKADSVLEGERRVTVEMTSTP